MVEEGGAPLWDENDPTTWASFGQLIKDAPKWADCAEQATQHGLEKNTAQAKPDEEKKSAK